MFTENCEALKSNHKIFVIDVAEELKEIKYEPKNFVDIPTVTFQNTRKSDCDCLIEETFGYIKKMKISGVPVGAQTLNNPLNVHELDKSPILDEKIKTLLKNPSLLNTRKLSFDPRSVEITKEGTICLRGCGSDVLHLLDTNGGMREIIMDSNIRDIAVHPVSDDVYCTLTDNSID